MATRLSYIHHVGKEPLIALTIGSLLEIAAKKYRNSVAIVSRAQNQKITYGELLQQADKLAAGFRLIGLEKGDRLGLWAPNMVEWVVTKLASARAGLVLIPINPMYVADEMKYCINKVGIKAIVCPDVIKHVSYYEILNQITTGIETGQPGKLNCKEIPSLRSIITISGNTQRGTYNYSDILELADEKSIKNIQSNQHMVQPDDPYCVQFSSGTTGQPKAAILSHFTSVNNAFFIGKGYELGRKRHIGCVQVPFFHVFGDITILGSLLHYESTVVIPSLFYNPLENLRAIKEETCSIIYGTPTMYVDLISSQREHNWGINPEIAVSGGSPCSPTIFKQMKEILKVKKVKSIYGLTEATSAIFESLPEEDEYLATSTVGHVNEHVEAKVVDSENKLVPFGTPGELCIRSYSNMLGYWNDVELTKKVLGNDRWLRTGDQFILYENGYGKVVGRLKDVIIRGGENIFPKEVEDFINMHPNIKESCVVGLPHNRLGEEVCACIRTDKRSIVTLELLTEFCKGKLARYKIPTVLKIVDNFPKTQSGKPQKFILKQQLVSGQI